MKRYRISEMAKEVGVENHVLRYWEDELQIVAKRNELGHRYYTEEDLKLYQEIKRLKEGGVQLKGIKTILFGNQEEQEEQLMERKNELSLDVNANFQDSKQLKLQTLLHVLIQDAVNQSNQQFATDLKESILKELDYQFRQVLDEQERLHFEEKAMQEKYFEKLDRSIQKEFSSRTKKRIFLFKNKMLEDD